MLTFVCELSRCRGLYPAFRALDQALPSFLSTLPTLPSTDFLPFLPFLHFFPTLPTLPCTHFLPFLPFLLFFPTLPTLPSSKFLAFLPFLPTVPSLLCCKVRGLRASSVFFLTANISLLFFDLVLWGQFICYNSEKKYLVLCSSVATYICNLYFNICFFRSVKSIQ